MPGPVEAGKPKEVTPWDRLNKKLDDIMEREKVEGIYPVRGPLDESASDEYDSDEDDEEQDTEARLAKLSEEKCKKVRWILVGKEREAELEKGSKLACAGQHGDMLMMFNTSTGNQVIMASIRQLAKIKKLSSAKEQFNALLGLTIAIADQNDWMPDNDCGYVDDLIEKLGKAWKSLLKKSDAELGIDPEFTRPGVEAVLTKFEKEVSYVQDQIGSIEEDFVWR